MVMLKTFTNEIGYTEKFICHSGLSLQLTGKNLLVQDIHMQLLPRGFSQNFRG